MEDDPGSAWYVQYTRMEMAMPSSECKQVQRACWKSNRRTLQTVNKVGSEGPIGSRTSATTQQHRPRRRVQKKSLLICLRSPSFNTKSPFRKISRKSEFLKLFWTYPYCLTFYHWPLTIEQERDTGFHLMDREGGLGSVVGVWFRLVGRVVCDRSNYRCYWKSANPHAHPQNPTNNRPNPPK